MSSFEILTFWNCFWEILTIKSIKALSEVDILENSTSHQMCSIKKNVKKISQSSQENTSLKSEAFNSIKKEVLGQMISCELLQIMDSITVFSAHYFFMYFWAANSKASWIHHDPADIPSN